MGDGTDRTPQHRHMPSSNPEETRAGSTWLPSTVAGSREGMPWFRRHQLLTFSVLVFAITWVVWIPRAVGVPVGLVGTAWTWAPAAAALLAAYLTGGRASLKDLGARLVRWRVGWRWYLLVILGPACFSLAVAATYVLLGGTWANGTAPSFSEVPWAVLPMLLLILALTDGLGEEMGWRGFALPRLLGRHTALTASLALGLLWALWHLPLLWTEGSAIYGLPIWILFLDLTAKSVLFTWVYLRTRGSLIIAILFHAATNLFLVSPNVSSAGDETLPALAAAAKWVLVGIALMISGRALLGGSHPTGNPPGRADSRLP